MLAKFIRKELTADNVYEQDHSGAAGTSDEEPQNKMNMQCIYLKFSRWRIGKTEQVKALKRLGGPQMPSVCPNLNAVNCSLVQTLKHFGGLGCCKPLCNS